MESEGRGRGELSWEEQREGNWNQAVLCGGNNLSSIKEKNRWIKKKATFRQWNNMQLLSKREFMKFTGK